MPNYLFEIRHFGVAKAEKKQHIKHFFERQWHTPVKLVNFPRYLSTHVSRRQTGHGNTPLHQRKL